MTFPELADPDFPCPSGKPWIETPWDVACREIDAAADAGDWAVLRRQLAAARAMIEIHGDRLGDCWIKRQRRRIVAMHARCTPHS
jgi:hypothetical protein